MSVCICVLTLPGKPPPWKSKRLVHLGDDAVEIELPNSWIQIRGLKFQAFHTVSSELLLEWFFVAVGITLSLLVQCIRHKW